MKDEVAKQETPEVECNAASAVVEAAALREPSSSFLTPVAKKAKQQKGVPGSSLIRSSSGALSSGASSVVDVDLEESEPGSKDSKAQSSTNKEETPQVSVMKWKAKLDLEKMLHGERLGVSMRHAQASSLKMPVKEKLELQQHLKLAVHATSLASHTIQTLSPEAIMLAVTTLESEAKIEFPSTLQVRLWNAKSSHRRCPASVRST